MHLNTQGYVHSTSNDVFQVTKKKRRDHDINCHVPMLSFNGKNVTFLRFISIKRGDLKNNLQYVIE